MRFEIFRTRRIKTGIPAVFSCEVPQEYRTFYKRFLESVGDDISITLSASKKTRSTGEHSQNHHLNGHIQQIAMHTGNTFEDVKLFVKRRAFARGLPFMVDSEGEPILSLNDYEPLPISERDMTTEQCGWCIEEAHTLAGEFGIVLVEE